MASDLVVHERNGEYGIEIAVGSERFYAIIDTGFTNPFCHTGLCVETALFDRLTPRLRRLQTTRAYDVTGKAHLLHSGVTMASIVGLEGSNVETRVLNGGSNIVGACFFTRLTGFRLEWILSDRTMRIWRP